MRVVRVIAIIVSILGSIAVAQNEGQLRFSDRRRRPEGLGIRPQNGDGVSNIENLFKIPVTVIKGTAAAAQAFYPQSSEAIDKIFDIPVMTLDAVGNYIKERPQRLGSQNAQRDSVEESPVRFGNQMRLTQRRDERRERITKLREQERLERERRRLVEQERFFFGGHHSIGLDDWADALSDLLFGHSAGHGHHGHGQLFGKPPKRPIKPIKPSKPHRPHRPHKPHKPGHFGGIHGGNSGYEVHEHINDSPLQSSGVFSWFQTALPLDEPKIENKIAPGYYQNPNDRDVAEFRAAQRTTP